MSRPGAFVQREPHHAAAGLAPQIGHFGPGTLGQADLARDAESGVHDGLIAHRHRLARRQFVDLRFGIGILGGRELKLQQAQGVDVAQLVLDRRGVDDGLAGRHDAIRVINDRVQRQHVRARGDARVEVIDLLLLIGQAVAIGVGIVGIGGDVGVQGFIVVVKGIDEIPARDLLPVAQAVAVAVG